MKKVLSLLLALVVCIAVLASCTTPDTGVGDGSSDSNPSDQSQTPESSGSNEPETPNDYEEAGLPDGLDFGKEPVTIVHWERWDTDDTEFYISSEDLDGNPVNDAIYKRNLYTEQLLNVDLEFVHLFLETGNLKEMLDWCERLQNMMSDPSTPVDLIASYSRCVATATVRGVPQNLSVYDALDFEKEWWPQYIKEEFEIGGDMYFATGDISTNLLYSLYMIFFNENLVESYGMDNPYDLVNSREWTISKMIEMNSSVYEDLDGTEGKSAGDKFSFTMEWWGSDAFIQGADFQILENPKDSEDYIKLSDDFTSEKFGDFIKTLGEWCALDSVYNQRGYDESASGAFKDGRSVFHLGPAEVGKVLQDVDFTYGIVPPPMLDPDAQDYLTTICEDYTIYCMAYNCTEGDRAAAVIQTMGYYANKFTTPAVFDVTFKGKFSKTEEMANMFDRLKSVISFDMGLLYQRQLIYVNDWPTEAIRDNMIWANKANPVQMKGFNQKLNILNDDLRTLVGR